MKIVSKLYLFSLSLIGILIPLLLFSVYQQRSIIIEIDQIIERDLDISNSLSRLLVQQLDYSIHLERMARHVLEQRLIQNAPNSSNNIFDPDAKSIEEFSYLLTSIQARLGTGAAQSNYLTTNNEFAILNQELKKIQKLHDNYIDISVSFFRQLEQGIVDDLALYTIAFETIEDELNSVIEDTNFTIQSFTADSVKNIKLHESRTLHLYTLIGGLFLLVVCTFLFIIIRKIRYSIRQAVQFAENIEAGRREVPKEIRSKDEISQIIHAMEFMLRSINQAEGELKRLALTDSLTSIANRLNFNTTLDMEIERTRRYKHPLSLIMFDIDHFKSFNDTYGHDAGDRILIELTALISKNTRANDLFARWGGEEFVLLLPCTVLHDAAAIAEKLRGTIEHNMFSDARKVTSSFGVCQFGEEDADTFLKRADIALYTSKESGRNMVTVGELPL